MQPKSNKQLKILIVEDDQFQRLTLSDIFKILGCVVVTSANGLAAYQELLNTNETTKFDCIFSNYEMAEMDGLELIKIIKKNNSIKDIPVVMMISNMRDEIKAQFISEGALECFQKPIRIGNIQEIFKYL